MLSNRLLKVILHPFFIGLVLTVGLFLLTPPWFNKYNVKEIDREYISGNDIYFYEDLDYDGTSEKIIIDRNNPRVTKFQLLKGKTQISNSCNLNQSTPGGEFFCFDDYNRDTIQELFIFTIRNDSIFLNILNLMSENPYLLTERYVDMQRPGEEAEIPQMDIIGLYDYDGDEKKELAFSINTGYRKQPRNCYIYNSHNDIILKSPPSGAPGYRPEFTDITGDNAPEIICGSLAPGNLTDSFPYSDQWGWLMAFDQNLSFVFTPVRFDRHPCYVSSVPLDFRNLKRLVVLKYYFGDDTLNSTLGLYDKNGKCMRQTELQASERALHIEYGNQGTFYLLGNSPSTIELRDSSFHVLREIEAPELFIDLPRLIDADGNGKKEYLYKGSKTGFYYLAEHDFSAFTRLKLENDPELWIYHCSNLYSTDRPPLIYIPFNNGGIFLSYAENGFYKFRVLIYLATYLFLSGILYMVYMMQRFLARIQYETKRRMNELQLRSVKNQMDPHFTFNVLNSIGSLYSQTENRKTADYLFGKYARLLRQTIVSSDQTEVSLEEELEFIRNYLDIEKFRLNNNFNYTIRIDDNTDTGIKIPRMLIHTFAENAVKYAVRQVEGEATLTIDVIKQGTKLSIILIDNGPGLKGNRKTEPGGTGKGLAIVDGMIRLYHEMTGVKISYSLEEVLEHGECKGMKAEIIVNLKI